MRKIVFSLIILTAFSCIEDDRSDFEPLRSSLVFDDGGRSAAERDEVVRIEFTLRTGASIQSIQVGGADVSAFEASSEEQQVFFDFTVPATAVVEEDLVIPVVINDELGRTLEREYVISVIKATVPFPSAIVDTDTKLDSSFNYLITENITVTNGATLTIPAFTNVVFSSDTATTGDFLDIEIEAGAQLVATGTSERPVVFTSDKALSGSGEAGQWGRIKINGSDGISSGTLRYVRIEYGGAKEVALRMDDVDESTEIEFVQIYESARLGMELRGGTVNLKHMVFTNNTGISIEYDNGDTDYTGFGQFFVLENSEFPSKDGAVRELESRDDANITLSNITIIGPGVSEDGSADPVRIRNDAGPTKFYNSVMADFPDDGFRFDPEGVITGIDGDNVVAHSYIFQIANLPTRDGNSIPLPFETEATTYSNVIDKTGTPGAAEGIESGSFVPDAIIDSAFDPSTLDPFFDPAPYVGAIGDTDWTSGWTRD